MFHFTWENQVTINDLIECSHEQHLEKSDRAYYKAYFTA